LHSTTTLFFCDRTGLDNLDFEPLSSSSSLQLTGS
jgi:hypothetical protein